MQISPGIRRLVERQRREATVPPIGRGSEGTGTLAERCDCSITLRKTRNALGTYTLLPWRRGAQQSGMSRFGGDAVRAGGVSEEKNLAARTVEHVWFAGVKEEQAWLRTRSVLTAPQVERLFAVADGWGRHGMPLATVKPMAVKVPGSPFARAEHQLAAHAGFDVDVGDGLGVPPAGSVASKARA